MSFVQSVPLMDAALMRAFGQPVVLHLPEGDRPVLGIFDTPHNLAMLKGGGHIDNAEPELLLCEADAQGIELRHWLTVANQVWQVVRPPEPDGHGMITLILGTVNEQQPKPAIRY